MQEIVELQLDGEQYLLVTEDGETRLARRTRRTHTSLKDTHEIEVINVWVVTRNNGDPLFILRGSEEDKKGVKVRNSVQIYAEKLQWFEPLADHYRELIWLNPDEEKIREAYRWVTWQEVLDFSLIDRFPLEYRKEASGDWKHAPEGGDGFRLVMVDSQPYWADAVGQIPFAIDTYRMSRNVKSVVQSGINWAKGVFWERLMGDVDLTNEYDNFFVLRGALYAEKNFTYKVTQSGKYYPKVKVEEVQNNIPATQLAVPITPDQLANYGIWNK